MNFIFIPPTIASFSPWHGEPGTTVWIIGTNLTWATAVAFGGTAAANFTVNSNTQITATVGSGATGAITVTTPAGTATSSSAFYCSPNIFSFTPTSGPSGAVVTISGSGFTGTTWVDFGGTPAASFSVVDDATLTATVAGGATGLVTVTTPYGTDSS